MIRIDRGAVQKPEIFQYEAPRLLEKLRSHFESPKRGHFQAKSPFDERLKRSTEVREALKSLFKGRCAFCETYVGSQGDVEEFRPRHRAAQADRSVDPDHYWWLAYAWENFYLCCRRCNYNKASRFPTKNVRARPGTVGAALRIEDPLLLDPCDVEPAEHLRFERDGTIIGLTRYGEATIATFGLDRPSLISERRELYESVRVTCERRFPDIGGPLSAQPADVIQALEEFSNQWLAHPSMVRLAIEGFLQRHAVPDVKPELFADKGNAELIRNRAVWLTQIEIFNYKAIDHLKLEFPSAEERPPSDAEPDEAGVDRDGAEALVMRQPWLMVLGENGVGKSTLLKAIALALMPAEQRKRYEPDASKVITRGSRKKQGLIRLHFDNLSEPFELQFHREHKEFTVVGTAPDIPVLGYGSTRLLSAPGKPRQPQVVSIESLFNPRHEFANAEAVIARQKKISDDHFDLLAANLRNLLSLGEHDYIERHAGKLRAHIGRKNISLRELSDGYQSVMALAMDIMHNLSSRTFDMDAVEGLVLLDEIELHLHPRWKIQIVNLLRDAFPRVRFIVTTHDPLCVHGLKKGELQIMTKHPEGHYTDIRNRDIPPGRRADDILTGPWFGISSTLDADTLQLMRRHSALLLSGSSTSAADIARMRSLEDELRQRLGRFGDTRADRIGMIAEAAMDVGYESGERDAITQHRLTALLNGKPQAGGSDA
jgi:predicted ATPase